MAVAGGTSLWLVVVVAVAVAADAFAVTGFEHNCGAQQQQPPQLSHL